MVYDNFKIQRATNFYPKWWQDLPAYPKIPTKESPITMKGCYGFLEMYRKSFILPLWSDLLITSELIKEVSLEYDSSIKKIEKKRTILSFGLNVFENQENSFLIKSHDMFQFKNCIDHLNWTHFKLISPWLIECNENINFQITDCFYNRQDLHGLITIIPGIFNFKASNRSNINGFVKNNLSDLLIKADTPLVYIIPLTERPVKIFYHLDPYKFDLLMSDTHYSVYYKAEKKLRKILEREKKCPF